MRICLVINRAQQSIGLYLPALVLVAKQRCFCSLSSSLSLSALLARAAAAATTAIDNKRRRRRRLRFPSCLCFRVSFYEWRQRRDGDEEAAKANDQKTQGTNFYMQNIVERRNGVEA